MVLASGLIGAAQHVSACTPVPALSYLPADVGWFALVLSVLDLLAGVACVGVVGNLLKWAADDPAPLRRVWMALIALGFLASAVGLYIDLANQAHIKAVQAWLMRQTSECLLIYGHTTNVISSTVSSSVQLGAVALALIALGIGGATIERRRVVRQ
jgi:hypothetical protein